VQKRRFGNSKREVPLVGQGTWLFEQSDRKKAITALQAGVDLGLSHIDTAEMYGRGEAERMVGEAIAGRRDEVFLVSKVLPENASRAGTIKACEGSLARLQTDHLDCYLLHWRGQHPLEETIAAFQRLRDQGKIRSWGVSNFDVSDLEETRAIAGKDGPACNQVLYHLQQRAIEHEVLPWCDRHGVALVGYSPFGHGHFPSAHSPAGRVLALIAAAHSTLARICTPRQVALAFLMRRAPLFTIPKAADPAHVAHNAGALDLRLGHSEIAEIETAFALGPPPAELPAL
jgi:diketogulonate reductase-like aldo/keto reductase